MKEQRNVLILTGTPAANKQVDKLLSNAGIVTVIGQDPVGSYMSDQSPVREITANGVVARMDPKGVEGDYTVYNYARLTPELVATFPNAKQQPPTGPWGFEGRMWEIDGDEKRCIKMGDVYYFNDEITRATCSDGEYIRDGEIDWILRPIITAELQAAMDHQHQTAKVVSEARKANREALAKIAELNPSHNK